MEHPVYCILLTPVGRCCGYMTICMPIIYLATSPLEILLHQASTLGDHQMHMFQTYFVSDYSLQIILDQRAEIKRAEDRLHWRQTALMAHLSLSLSSGVSRLLGIVPVLSVNSRLIAPALCVCYTEPIAINRLARGSDRPAAAGLVAVTTYPTHRRIHGAADERVLGRRRLQPRARP